MDLQVAINIEEDSMSDGEFKKIVPSSSESEKNCDDNGAASNDNEGNRGDATPLNRPNKKRNKKRIKNKKGTNNNNKVNGGNTNSNNNSGCSYSSNKGGINSDKGVFVLPLGNCKNKENKKSDDNGNNSIKELHKIVKDLVSKIQKKSTYPLDSWILYLYHRWGVALFYGLFLNVWFTWFLKDPIVCISGFSADDYTAAHYKAICLSYPYIENDSTKRRRYILYYRWIHYSCLAIGLIFYLPRFFMKVFNDARLHNFLSQLSLSSKLFDERTLSTKRELVSLYVREHLGTHRKQALVFVLIHLLSACFGIMVFLFIDFHLQSDFIYLPFRTFPFYRDMRRFTDNLSQIFPPFVSCEISPDIGMANERNEPFTCHLTLMELYEKVFFFLWFFLFILISLSLIYSLFLLSIILPPIKCILLRTTYNPPGVKRIHKVLIRHLDAGDYFMLFSIKSYLSDKFFYIIQRDIATMLEMRKNGFNEEFYDILDSKVPCSTSMVDHATSTPASSTKPKTDANLRNRKACRESILPGKGITEYIMHNS